MMVQLLYLKLRSNYLDLTPFTINFEEVKNDKFNPICFFGNRADSVVFLIRQMFISIVNADVSLRYTTTTERGEEVFTLNGANCPDKYTRIMDFEDHDANYMFNCFKEYKKEVKSDTLFLAPKISREMTLEEQRTFFSKAVHNKRALLIMSTDLPVLISDCYQKNVYIVNKKRTKIHVDKPDFETYGSAFDYILMELYNMPCLLTERVKKEMRQICRSDDISVVKDGVRAFGESFEKKYMYQRICELEEK